MTDTTDGRPPSWAVILGYGGLIPFATLAASLWFVGDRYQSYLGSALVGYGAMIASFLGAIHWGLAMRDGSSHNVAPYVWGVVPSLVAWLALFPMPTFGLAIITTLLLACYKMDSITYPRYQLQQWLPIRLRLTAVASTSCVVGAAGLLR
jgi:hypothetical protein